MSFSCYERIGLLLLLLSLQLLLLLPVVVVLIVVVVVCVCCVRCSMEDGMDSLAACARGEKLSAFLRCLYVSGSHMKFSLPPSLLFFSSSPFVMLLMALSPGVPPPTHCLSSSTSQALCPRTDSLTLSLSHLFLVIILPACCYFALLALSGRTYYVFT